MKKLLFHFIISVLLIALFVLIMFNPKPKVKEGIEFLRESNKLAIYANPDFSLPYYVGFSNDVNFSQVTIENSTTSLGPEKYLSEYSFKGKAGLDESEQFDVRVTNRFFTNSDALIFFRFFTENELSKPLVGEVEIPLNDINDITVRSLVYDSSSKPTEIEASDSKMIKYNVSLREDNMFSILPATLNYVEFKKDNKVLSSALIGPLSVFRDKEIHLRELKAQKFQPVLSYDKGKSVKISFSFNLSPFQYEENWIFLSRGRLLDYDDVVTTENMLSADLCMRKKLSIDGIYHIASSLYYVGASDISYDYYYNYAMWEGRRFMNLYLEGNNQRFFYDMAINSIYTTVKAVNTYGVWISDVRSKYLWDTYGIEEGYVDTRYCTDAGFFLLKANKEFQIHDALIAGEKFGNYLIDKYKNSEVIKTKNGGVFFYDYYSKNRKVKTHASLNHILSEMNYLYELYLATNNEDYLNMAELIKKALDETRDSWIRRDGVYRFRDDLWYAVYEGADGSLQFKDVDYTKTLTYEDLKRALDNMLKVYGRADETINILLESKKKFLIKEGFNIVD